MKFTSLLASSVALYFGSTTAIPVGAPEGNIIARQSPATSAEFTDFTVTCDSSSCSYSTAVTVLPDNIAVAFSHTTSGSTIPANSGFWTASDPAFFLRFNKVLGNYRIVLSDGRVAGSAVNLDYVSPGSDWPGDVAYTGPSSFTAT